MPALPRDDHGFVPAQSNETRYTFYVCEKKSRVTLNINAAVL